MLNWIAIWIGAFLFGIGGPLQNDTQAVRPDLERRRRGRKAPRLLGRPAAPGPPHRLLHRASARSSSTGRSSTARRSATASGRSASTPRRRGTAGSASPRNYFLAMAISGAFAGLAGAIDILGWQFRLSTSDVQRRRRRRSRSPASPSRCSAATRPSGVFFAALLFGALLTGTSTRNLDPESSSPSSRRT